MRTLPGEVPGRGGTVVGSGSLGSWADLAKQAKTANANAMILIVWVELEIVSLIIRLIDDQTL